MILHQFLSRDLEEVSPCIREDILIQMQIVIARTEAEVLAGRGLAEINEVEEIAIGMVTVIGVVIGPVQIEITTGIFRVCYTCTTCHNILEIVR